MSSSDTWIFGERLLYATIRIFYDRFPDAAVYNINKRGSRYAVFLSENSNFLQL